MAKPQHPTTKITPWKTFPLFLLVFFRLSDLLGKLLGFGIIVSDLIDIFVYRVANNEVFNQMSCSNLAIIFGPTLLKPRYVFGSLPLKK